MATMRALLLLGVVALEAAALQTNTSLNDADEESLEVLSNFVVFRVALQPFKPISTFKIELHPDWAPIGVRRFKRLVASKWFDNAAVFRVVPDFLSQFGLPALPKAEPRALTDDPAKVSNTRGTITFAASGPNSRTSQVFINTVDNSFLDARGFTPIGEVIEGMEVVDSFNEQYGDFPDGPDQNMIQSKGNMYLNLNFPRLSKIRTAKLLS